MCLFIVLHSLVLTIWDILPKYGKIIISSFLGTVGICSLWINILLRNFWMHLSINFCGYAFFDTILLSLSNSWWNFKKSEDKLKQRFSKVCTKPNLYWSGIKLMKLVYTPLNVSPHQSDQAKVWFRYIDDIYLFRLMLKKNIKRIWQVLMSLWVNKHMSQVILMLPCVTWG